MGLGSGLLAGQSVINAMLFTLMKFSVPSCMARGIIMLKKSDIGIILKQWDNVPRKNFISVMLGIQIPFDNDETVYSNPAIKTHQRTERNSIVV